MNAKKEVEQNETMVMEIIETAKRISKDLNLTLEETLEIGRKVKMKYAFSDNEIADINILYNKALNAIKK